jgi:hypothetical protein
MRRDEWEGQNGRDSRLHNYVHIYMILASVFLLDNWHNLKPPFESTHFASLLTITIPQQRDSYCLLPEGNPFRRRALWNCGTLEGGVVLKSPSAGPRSWRVPQGRRVWSWCLSTTMPLGSTRGKWYVILRTRPTIYGEWRLEAVSRRAQRHPNRPKTQMGVSSGWETTAAPFSRYSSLWHEGSKISSSMATGTWKSLNFAGSTIAGSGPRFRQSARYYLPRD